MDGGIKLDMDDDGNVQVVESEDLDHYCVANMTCKYAQRTEIEKSIKILCHFENKKRNVFEFKHCPAKKWLRYKHLHSPEITQKPGCYMCGQKKQWKFKDSNWICFNCHPPKIFEKNEIEIKNG